MTLSHSAGAVVWDAAYPPRPTFSEFAMQIMSVAFATFGTLAVLAVALRDTYLMPLVALPFFALGGINAARRLRHHIIDWQADPEFRSWPKPPTYFNVFISIFAELLCLGAIALFVAYLTTRWGVRLEPFRNDGLNLFAIASAILAPITSLSVVGEWLLPKVGERNAKRTVIALTAAAICAGVPFATAAIEWKALVFLAALGAIALQTLAPDFVVRDLASPLARFLRTRAPAA